MLILKIIEYFFICLCIVIIIGIMAFAFSPAYISKRYNSYKKQLKDIDVLLASGDIKYNDYMAKKYKLLAKIEEIEEMYKRAYEYETNKEAKESLEEGDQYD